MTQYPRDNMRQYLKVDQIRGWTGVLLYRRQVLKLAREMVF